MISYTKYSSMLCQVILFIFVKLCLFSNYLNYKIYQLNIYSNKNKLIYDILLKRHYKITDTLI